MHYFFPSSAIGMPQIETVRVFNPHPGNTLRMDSLEGSTPHFHCSFFQDKVRSLPHMRTSDSCIGGLCTVLCSNGITRRAHQQAHLHCQP